MKNLQNVKILVVDDDENFREILRLNLQKAGFANIQEASNGNEALELLPILKPDLVILDVIMPDKDGIDVALEIKSKEEFKNTKFIFLTNYGEDILKEAGKETDKKVAQELGALDFFRKTDDINVLINKIKEILKV
jgi:two-component system, OmpR family, alkaline phosphatase synthesis response regulator PhoP